MTVASQRASFIQVPSDWSGSRKARCGSSRRALYACDIEAMETASSRGPKEVHVMKLYYSPGACSLSPHIVSREAGINLELEQVDNREKKTKSGKDFWGINPKGQVPVLEIDGAQRLTEGPAIVQYLADQKPASGLVPAAGTIDRYRVLEWLNFVASELHKTYGPMFRPTTPEEYKTMSRENLGKRF